jgi:hypothetical protein
MSLPLSIRTPSPSRPPSKLASPHCASTNGWSMPSRLLVGPTQPRRERRHRKSSRRRRVERLSLLWRTYDHHRDLCTRLPAAAVADPIDRARQLMTITPLSHPSSLRRSDADLSPATPMRGQRQSSTPPSTAKTQIIQRDITLLIPPVAIKTAIAAPAPTVLPVRNRKIRAHASAKSP